MQLHATKNNHSIAIPKQYSSRLDFMGTLHIVYIFERNKNQEKINTFKQ